MPDSPFKRFSITDGEPNRVDYTRDPIREAFEARKDELLGSSVNNRNNEAPFSWTDTRENDNPLYRAAKAIDSQATPTISKAKELERYSNFLRSGKGIKFLALYQARAAFNTFEDSRALAIPRLLAGLAAEPPFFNLGIEKPGGELNPIKMERRGQFTALQSETLRDERRRLQSYGLTIPVPEDGYRLDNGYGAFKYNLWRSRKELYFNGILDTTLLNFPLRWNDENTYSNRSTESEVVEQVPLYFDPEFTQQVYDPQTGRYFLQKYTVTSFEEAEQLRKDLNVQYYEDISNIPGTGENTFVNRRERLYGFSYKDNNQKFKSRINAGNTNEYNIITDRFNRVENVYFENEDEIPNDIIKFRIFDVYNNRHFPFRATIQALTETITPNIEVKNYINRSDRAVSYSSTDRSVNFSFTIYVNNKEELPGYIQKINYLTSLSFSNFDSVTGFQVTPFLLLTVGDMYVRQPCVITSLTYTVDDNVVWEIEEGNQYPHAIEVQSDFQLLEKRIPNSIPFAERGNQFYGR